MLSEQPVFASRGMVACAHYLATQAGLQILTPGWKCYRCGDSSQCRDDRSVSIHLFSGW